MKFGPRNVQVLKLRYPKGKTLILQIIDFSATRTFLFDAVPGSATSIIFRENFILKVFVDGESIGIVSFLLQFREVSILLF